MFVFGETFFKNLLTSKLGNDTMMPRKLGKEGVNMKKEEILALSKEENKNGDERDKQNMDKAYALGALVGLAWCCIIGMIEILVFDRSITTIMVIYTGMRFSIFVISYISTKKKKMLLPTIAYGVLSIAFFLFYIGVL